MKINTDAIWSFTVSGFFCLLSPALILSIMIGMVWVLSWIMLGPFLFPMVLQEEIDLSYLQLFFIYNGIGAGSLVIVMIVVSEMEEYVPNIVDVGAWIWIASACLLLFLAGINGVTL